MVTSHVAHYGISSWHAHLRQRGSGASMLVGAKLQTILVPPELLHPSFSLCFNSQHFLALTLTEICETLVTPSFQKFIWWQMAQGKGRLKGKGKHTKSCKKINKKLIFEEVGRGDQEMD